MSHIYTWRALTLCCGLVSLLVLPACDPEPATTYPISGEECSPEDPVHDLGSCRLVGGGRV